MKLPAIPYSLDEQYKTLPPQNSEPSEGGSEFDGIRCSMLLDENKNHDDLYRDDDDDDDTNLPNSIL